MRKEGHREQEMKTEMSKGRVFERERKHGVPAILEPSFYAASLEEKNCLFSVSCHVENI